MQALRIGADWPHDWKKHAMIQRANLSSAAYARLGFADALSPGGDRFHIVTLTERGAQVDLPAGWASAWWVMRGTLSAHAPQFNGDVAAGRLLTWQDGPLRLASYGPVGAIGVAAPASLWCRHLSRAPGGSECLLLPWQIEPGHEVERLMVRVARLARQGQARHDAALGALLAALHETQAPLRAHLAACSGRTNQRREQVLMRLMRVRHLVTYGREQRLDLARLAEVANYSPTHLIRLYREVFGETPVEYAIRLRVNRSWSLVRDTRMPIGDISEVVGFESKSAFCRSFKATFGYTTSEVRRSASG